MAQVGYATGANQSASNESYYVFPAEMRVFPTVTVSVSGIREESLIPQDGGIAAVLKLGVSLPVVCLEVQQLHQVEELGLKQLQH